MNKISVQKSDEQIALESNGCTFRSQEPISRHTKDIKKPCFCGRQNNNTDLYKQRRI